MTLYSKLTSTWKIMDFPYVNVEGVWKETEVYQNVNGTWKGIHRFVGIPAGLIIMSVDGSVPVGWSEFTYADGSFIAGAGNLYASSTSHPQSAFTPLGITSGTSGGHNASLHTAAVNQTTYSRRATSITDVTGSDGAHTHVASITNYLPASHNIKLIQATTNMYDAPANGMFFSSQAIAGFNTFTSSSFLASDISVTTPVALPAMIDYTCSSAGGHLHTELETESNTDTAILYNGVAKGAHTHTVSIVADDAFKHAVLKGLYKTYAYSVTPGLIGMYAGATAPPRYSLCDGTNGTWDLRDCFIKFTTSTTSTASGTDQVTLSLVTNTKANSHIHGGTLTTGYNGGTVPSASAAYANSHSHTLAEQTFSYTPSCFALTFVQYTG